MKKRFVAIVLFLTLVFAGCTQKTPTLSVSEAPINASVSSTVSETSTSVSVSASVESQTVVTSVDVYTSFLKDSGLCKNGSKEHALEEGKEYTLKDLLKTYSHFFEEDYLPFHLVEFNYAYIDCGRDGEPELALSMSFSDEVMGYPSLFQYLILKNFDGELRLITGENGYYRTEADCTQYGVLSTYGSSSATSAGGSTHFVNGNGEDIFLYTEEEYCCLGNPVIPRYLLPSDCEVPSDYPDESIQDRGYNLWYVSFLDPLVSYQDNDTYKKELMFAFSDDNGNSVSTADWMISLYSDYNLKAYGTDELDAELKKHNAQLGATEDIMEKDYPYWNLMDVSALMDED